MPRKMLAYRRSVSVGKNRAGGHHEASVSLLRGVKINNPIRSGKSLTGRICAGFLDATLLKILEFHPGGQAKQLAEPKRCASAASLKSSPVQTPFGRLAAASGLARAHRLRPANHAFTPGRDSRSKFLKK